VIYTNSNFLTGLTVYSINPVAAVIAAVRRPENAYMWLTYSIKKDAAEMYKA